LHCPSHHTSTGKRRGHRGSVSSQLVAKESSSTCVVVYIVDSAPSSPYTHSCTPIEVTSLSATSVELGLDLGLSLCWGSLAHFSSHQIPFFSTPSLHTISLSPSFNRKILFRNGNLTLALAGWWRRRWAGRGVGVLGGPLAGVDGLWRLCCGVAAILLLHIISVRPSKHPLMIRTFLKVYMELSSYFLFLQEQIKDIIIMGGQFAGGRTSVFRSQSLLVRWVDAWGCGGERVSAWASSGRGQLQQACGFTTV
jgi:hypothetical protein